MNSIRLRSAGSRIALVAAVCLVLPATAATSATFQNGAGGYSGASDISINTQYAVYNGGNGVRWTGDPELGCYTTTGSGAYAARYLLKFANLGVAPGTQVTSATLTLVLDSWNAGPGNITGFYVKNSWNLASSRLGWVHRDDKNDWASGGASTAGTDTVAGKTFQVPALRPVGVQAVSIPLDLAQVQAWIDNPASNQGILLVNNNTGEIIRIVSNAGVQSQRPKLTIVLGGQTGGVSVSISPASASLQAGQTQAFTASVTGTSNTAVTWTATGGTITSSGVYTAGSTAGNYSVKATSVADPTKSATATVTVQAAPVVSVSISPASASLQAGQTQTFTASVTGTSNTAVTWTATGGTITSSGMYTAGSTAGNYSVKATSVADPTKSATATVTVQAAPAVSVSISPASASLQAGQTQTFTASVTGTSNTAVTWTATGGTITSSGVYTAGSTNGNYAVTATSVADATKSATAAVTISTVTSSGRPRILLDSATLATLRGRAQSNTAQWAAVKAVCDSFIGGGTINFPGDNGYPNRPSVGEGYQGDGYVAALMPLGLCYQTTLLSNPAAAAAYGAKGVAILMAMSDPAHQTVGGTPIWDRDDGYGIRNYGFAMGIGYDWFHDLMTASQLSQLQTALKNWIAGFENDSFEYDHPQGNYFAGYYAAKCMAALAVQGDNALGDTWWNDWYTKQHLQRVAPYYAANMAGGGWTEGFTQYGILGSKNQALPALAVKTAKGIDLIHLAQQPYTFPLDQGRYLIHFTWPTRDMMDDRGELYNSETGVWPGTTNLASYRFFAGYLATWGDPAAPMLHKYAKDVKVALDALHAASSEEWLDFLFWDENAPDADYSTLTPSYLAPGIGGVAARSDWTTGATFMSFISAPYINNPAAGHENFDKGTLAIERAKNPLLVNPNAWLAHDPNGSAGWTVGFNDRFGNWDADHTLGNRRLYNSFQVRHLDSGGGILDNYGQWALQRDDGARTTVGRYEDGGSYVLAVGQYLEDMYRPFKTICAGVSPVSTWSRQIVYLRPSQFVVYDRTGICDASLDQYLAFHFAANPVEATAPAAGLHRLDVNTGIFAGSMTTILPADTQLTTTTQLAPTTSTWNKVWRTEIRPRGAASATQRWLTVFDLASTPAQVASATAVNVTSGPAVGTLLQSASGNSVVIAGTAAVGTPISGTLTYVVPAAATRHVVTDLAPSTGYTVTVGVTGGNHTVTIAPGGSSVSTANGVLTFQVNASASLSR